MIEKIIEYSIRNRFVVLIVAAALAVGGLYAMLDTPIDAIPDLSENQVIVFTDWMGRSPREIEDQVTYPLSRKLQGLAGVRAVRSSSEFNFSMITLIFEDNVGYYFARQRVTEKLSQANTFLPTGVVPYLAPDATALGQIFWYTVEASPTNPVDQQRLWALNKFYVLPQLNSAAGVAEVATVGGTPVEYQVDVRPEALRAYGVTLSDLYGAVARSNSPAGGGVIQKNNAEYIVRGIGWIRDKRDIEDTIVKEVGGTPILVKHVATVQLGTQFRRSVFEKDGNEAVGGVVLMRHGENPLAITDRVKEKITELQPGLPKGVRIVPAYDRTRLIKGAIHTLTDVMWHEMVIAAVAIMLILTHLRSVFVICVTLPLSVLFSFLLMWLLRKAGIIDIQANIMSLAGITISIGILVDQAIVMTENATHTLKARFGNRPVTGDIRDLVIPACRLVGRPIFFSVLIMLISFIPVFMLSGREGKYFHPLAFTKSFAMIGVALISVTVVPALIPTFLKGRLKSEEENWIVRSFINIYKPFLTWALPRRNLVMWMFAALLILAAGIFPVQAVVGMGASDAAWKVAFLSVVFFVIALTVISTRRLLWQIISFVTLVLLALAVYRIDKSHRIGVEFMPPLDEGSIMDMPVTVPRASITQVADDLKHRDGLLRSFPEVESVIGKAGRADTPTDPAPLDMVETFVNFRPKELWPRRVLRFEDAKRQTLEVLATLESKGYLVRAPHEDDRDNLANDASQKALERFDETMRELALRRYKEVETELGPMLVRFAATASLRRFREAGELPEDSAAVQSALDSWLKTAVPEYGRWLSRSLNLDEANALSSDLAKYLHERKLLANPVDALALRNPFTAHLGLYGIVAASSVLLILATWVLLKPRSAFVVTTLILAVAVGGLVAGKVLKNTHLDYLLGQAGAGFGQKEPTFASALLAEIEAERSLRWRKYVKEINHELMDRGAEIYTWYALEETLKSARSSGSLGNAPHRAASEKFMDEALQIQLGKPGGTESLKPFAVMREELEGPFRGRTFLWPRKGGKDGDLVADEMNRVMQVPGWSNIFTMPIVNRIDMLSTGVRTDIGVKVYGPDLGTVDRVSKEVEAVLKPLRGASDVIASPIMGKGYLEIEVDRVKAARYGIAVEDVQSEIEVALGGKVVTYTVEKRDRFPVRIRYARTSREDESSVRNLLIAVGIPGGPTGDAMEAPTAPRGMSQGQGTAGATGTASTEQGQQHRASPDHVGKGRALIPLSAVADVRIVEGPSMIRSENGRLLNTVTLMVRGRDMLGFVDEAQRAVTQKVTLPEGVSLAWSGEFEHQVRAARTLRFVFPAVIALIFVMLYLTYQDFADASLMMLAVPEALAGGIFFLWLFPKVMHGWSAPPWDFSVAVWVGFIACFGMATETGIIMLVYLREAIESRGGLEKIKSLEELRQAVIEGAVHRLRPKLLTEGVAIIAIFPMVFATGVGGEILAPMALPVLGGLLIADEVVDIFLPVRFYWVRRARWLKLHGDQTGLNTLSN
ncbi:MAG: efflux RND transporter permease subunit [Planctomycetia bacterium]|nr:efflux RND transporter permease subunit [Planctomycetia bacterium]